jgi:SAM-dependent methyltransferase
MPWQLNIADKMRGHTISKVTPSYKSFAVLYDALFGKPMLPLFIRNFKWLVLRYRILFHTAADVGCGTGSFARYLRQWGIPVLGIDLSPNMIAIAKYKNRDPGISYLVQDMRDLTLPYPVDLITCNFDVINYLLRISDLNKAFIAFRKNLTASGHLIFDIITDAWQEPGPFRYVRNIIAPNIISVWFIIWNPHSQTRTVFMINFIKSKDGGFRREYEIHKERSYPIGFIYMHLNNSGYQVCGIHDAYRLRPATRSTTRAVFVVKKIKHIDEKK